MRTYSNEEVDEFFNQWLKQTTSYGHIRILNEDRYKDILNEMRVAFHDGFHTATKERARISAEEQLQK